MPAGPSQCCSGGIRKCCRSTWQCARPTARRREAPSAAPGLCCRSSRPPRTSPFLAHCRHSSPFRGCWLRQCVDRMVAARSPTHRILRLRHDLEAEPFKPDPLFHPKASGAGPRSGSPPSQHRQSPEVSGAWRLAMPRGHMPGAT